MAINTQDFTTLVRNQVTAIQGAASGLVDLTVGSILRAVVEAVEALVESEPLIVHAIRRDTEQTPGGRGGALHFQPATPGWGGSGCPGDNVTRWLDDLRAAIASVTGGAR